jgi:hypothetical protein
MGTRFLLAGKAWQEVLGRDGGFVADHRFGARKEDGWFGFVCVALEH